MTRKSVYSSLYEIICDYKISLTVPSVKEKSDLECGSQKVVLYGYRMVQFKASQEDV
jgi:hypothetical protein